MQKSSRPILGISVGDPGGIGPEITAKALNQSDIYDIAQPIVVGDFRVVEDALRFSDVKLTLNPIQEIQDARLVHGMLDILDIQNWSKDDEFKAFTDHIESLTKAINERLTPPEAYMMSVFKNLQSEDPQREPSSYARVF